MRWGVNRESIPSTQHLEKKTVIKNKVSVAAVVCMDITPD